MKTQHEHHPLMIGMTIGTQVIGIILASQAHSLYASVAGLDVPSSIDKIAFWVTVLAIVLILSPAWVLIKTNSFKKWSALPNGQKILSYFIMSEGPLALIALMIIVAVSIKI